VWLIDWPIDPILISPICSKHAEALSVPAGWLLHDDRDGESSLFAERSVAAADSTGSTRATVARLDHRRAQRDCVVEELQLFEVPESDETAVAADRSPAQCNAETAGLGHNPGAEWIGEPEERSNELLEVDAATPLLARAFRASQAS
jgi:hypothetical protein